MRLLFAFLLALSAWLVPRAEAQLVTTAPWNQVGQTTRISSTSSSTAAQLGWIAAAPDQPPPTVRVCNTGSVAAWITLGKSLSITASSTVPTNSAEVLAGSCPLFLLNGATHIAAISASATTLDISSGTGSPQSGGIGGAGSAGTSMMTDGSNATSAALAALITGSGSVSGTISWSAQDTALINIAGLAAMRFPLDSNSSRRTILGPNAATGMTAASILSTAVGTDSCGALGAGMSGIENTCFGFGAGSALTTGTYNTFLGLNAGASTATETGAIAIGVDTLKLSTAGGAAVTAIGNVVMKNPTAAMNHNTGVGSNVLQGQTSSSGTFNTFMGSQAGAGTSWSSGSHNAVFGYNALNAITTASSNAAFGDSALQVCTTCQTNTALGYFAGNSVVSASNNTFVGRQAGQLVTGGTNTIIGALVGSTTLTSGSNNVLIGTTADVTTAAAGTSNTIQIGAGSTAVFSATGAGTPSTSVATMAGTFHARAPLATGSSTGNTFTTANGYFVCTSTCTVTPPVPVAGQQFCVYNDNNVSTVITLGAIGSSARYENTARTAYGTAGTGTFTSGGAVGDKVCIVGLDSTHFSTLSFTGTWTAS